MKCQCGKKVAPTSEVEKCWDCDTVALQQAKHSEECWKCHGPKPSGPWLCASCEDNLIAEGEAQSEREQDPCRAYETL